MKIAGLIAAAGTSSRMKFCKALLAFDNTTFVEHLVKNFISAEIKPVIVTVPQQQNPPTPFIKGRLNPETKIQVILNPYPVLQIENQFPALGLIGSIRSCLKFLPSDTKHLVIAPIDCPLVSKELLVALTHSASSKLIVIPTFQGRRGHPIMISQSFFAELKTKETDLGMKQFLQNHPHLVQELPWYDEAILHNINTPEDYNSLNHLL